MKPAIQPEVRYSEMGARTGPSVISDLMSRALENPDLLSIAAGFTDNAVLPKALVGEAVAALTAEASPNEILQYGTTQGRPGLREAIASWLQSYPGEAGAGIRAGDIVVTNGSQQCLYLAMEMLCDPGDIVLVERPSYFVYLEMLKGLGVEAVGMPVLPDGRLDLPGVEALLKELKFSGRADRVKAVYLVSYFANPSSRCTPEADKVGLARLLEDHDLGVPVMEDAAYRDLYFHQPYPARTIFSLEAFERFPRLFLGTFTKPFSTGMKIGYGVCSHPELLGKMLSTKGNQDFGSSNFNQAILEWVMRNDGYRESLKQQRSHYLEKAGIMHEALLEFGLAECGWRWRMPEGGILIWAEGPPDLDTRIGSPFCEACIERGVLYVPGDLSYSQDPPRNCVRLSYGALAKDQLVEACRRFTEVARQFS